MYLLPVFAAGICHFLYFGVAGDSGVLRFLAPGLPVLGDRRLADFVWAIHG